MNATEKAKILKERGYSWGSSKRSGTKTYNWYLKRNPLKTIASGTSFAETTQRVYDYEFDLEAQRTQAANDAAGEAAYEEVKEEFATSERAEKLAKRLGWIENTETAQLRAENEALKAENLRLEAKSVLYQRALQTLYEDTASWSLDRMRRFAKTAMNPTNEAIEADLQDLQDAFDFHKSLQSPAPTAQAASEVAPVPKNPVPTRCRVNWNKRGFSSGSYPVLGYSPEKQYYILDISTDCSRAMPKPVRFADCLAVQS